MKLFVIFFCVFQACAFINVIEINQLNSVFSSARLDSSLLQNYAKYIISQNGSSDGKANSIFLESLTELSNILKKLSTGEEIVQIKQLLQNVYNLTKLAIETLKSEGIQEDKILAVGLPHAYNDLVHLLSLSAHKLNPKIQIVNYKKPENPKFKVAKPHKTARNTFKRALRRAIKEAKRLKVLAPRIIRSISQPQTTAFSDFEKFLTNLANYLEKILASKPVYATGAKDVLMHASTQIKNILQIFEKNGIKEAPVIFEMTTIVFVDMIAELKHFKTAF